MNLEEKVGIKGRYKITATRGGEVLSETDWINNLVMIGTATGLNLVLRALAGEETYPLEIIKAKLGTATATPVSADTDLGSPVVDNILVATVSYTNSVLTIKFFASDADVTNGTYNEFGIYCGTAVAAARLFARSIITPAYVKASGVDTTVTYQITASNT